MSQCRIIFITNNHATFHLLWKKNLVVAHELFYDGGPYYNQWTGSYMIGMKELTNNASII